jgi:2-polyprenyl-6-methoxyphenol hydroxylase-like FAD-dependent oxidoreductase
VSEASDREAVVIGASMTGLMVARVLSRHFGHVTVLERDEVVDEARPRKGQPHARHLHSLLAQGLTILERLFPNLRDDLCAGGAMLGDMGADIRWWASGGYRKQFPSGMTGVMASRPFLEQCVRRRVAALPNVTIRGGADVSEALTTADRRRITGVRLKRPDGTPGETVEADFCVDASGRGSASPRWLEALGYGRPPESVVKVDMGYSTRTYRRTADDLPGAKLLLISPNFGTINRSGYLIPVEGDRWVAALGGWGADFPPAGAAEFMEFSRGLPAPDFHEVTGRLEPLTDIIQHRIPSHLRRHYESMRHFPERYLVLGDAVSSFNPVYAQGMTSAAMQVAVLDQVLSERKKGTLDGIRERHFPRAAKVVGMAWRLAVGEDFRTSTTSGPKPLGTDLINPYVARVHKATHVDPDVYRVFLDVMNLVRPPSALLAPRVVWRVLRAS